MRGLSILIAASSLLALPGGRAGDAPALVYPAQEAFPVSRPRVTAAVSGQHETSPLPVDGLGVIVPAQATDVAAPYAGRVSRVLVRLGDHVPAGATVASLAIDLSRHDLEVARATVAARASELDRALLEQRRMNDKLSRIAKLAGANLATEEELSDARFELESRTAVITQARAELSERRARAAQLEVSQGLAEIRAPFSGTIAYRYVDAGATVGPGQSIVRILEDGDARIRFAVREVDAARIALGTTVIARPKTTPDAPGWNGVIDRIAPEVDVASRTLFVEARITDANATDAPALGAIVTVIADVTSKDVGDEP